MIINNQLGCVVKYCGMCKRTKAISEFYKSTAYKQGVKPNCKACICAISRKSDKKRYDAKKLKKMDDSETTLVCKICNQEKSILSFHCYDSYFDKLANICDVCQPFKYCIYEYNNHYFKLVWRENNVKKIKTYSYQKIRTRDEAYQLIQNKIKELNNQLVN